MNYEVLIPAHKAQRTIGRAVASATGQSLRPSAVRVCVDGLSDNAGTLELARSAGATHVMQLSDNVGVGSVRQRLLEASESDLVVYLDSDDALAPSAAEYWAEGLVVHPDADVIAFGWATFQETIGTDQKPQRLGMTRLSHEDLWKRNWITSSAAIIRRRELQDAGGYSEGSRCLVDYEAWLRLVSRGAHIYASSLPVVHREVGNSTITANVNLAVLRETELKSAFTPAGTNELHKLLRNCEIWVRGLSRHLDYGKPALDYVSTHALCDCGARIPRVLDALKTPVGVTVWQALRRTRRRTGAQ